MHSVNNTLIILTPGFPGSEADMNCLPMQQGFVRTVKENYPHLNIIILAFQYPYIKKTYPWFDTTVISFDGKNKGGLATLLRRRELNATLKNIHGNNKITGILSFWVGECAAIGKKFADKYNLRHYCWILGQDARIENKFPGRIHPNAGELIALSDFLQDEFEKNHGVRPLYVVPPGIDARQFLMQTKERDIDILGVGSLIPLKQYEIFLEILTQIKVQLPAVKAMLVGNGSEKEKLQNLILKYGLEQNIILTGELPHNKVLELMQRTKVFLHPSSYEGFSGVCQEALAAGSYVISFCRAMKKDIEYWHMVNSKEEMKQKALAVLQDRQLSFKPVIPFLMNDTVKKMMALFGH